MRLIRWEAPALLNGALSSQAELGECRGDFERTAATQGSTQWQRREVAGARGAVDPLPIGVVAAGGGELVSALSRAGRARWRGEPVTEAVGARIVHAGALLASRRRAEWRLPLLSCLIGLRLASLVGVVRAGRSRRPARGRPALAALWLAVLSQLWREAARAESWDTKLSR